MPSKGGSKELPCQKMRMRTRSLATVERPGSLGTCRLREPCICIGWLILRPLGPVAWTYWVFLGGHLPYWRPCVPPVSEVRAFSHTWRGQTLFSENEDSPSLPADSKLSDAVLGDNVSGSSSVSGSKLPPLFRAQIRANWDLSESCLRRGHGRRWRLLLQKVRRR